MHVTRAATAARVARGIASFDSAFATSTWTPLPTAFRSLSISSGYPLVNASLSSSGGTESLQAFYMSVLHAPSTAKHC